MSQMPTPAEMRARFLELSEQAAAIRANVEPLRTARDEFVNNARATEQGFNNDIQAAEVGLFEIEQERAMIVRALAGKTGETVEEEPV